MDSDDYEKKALRTEFTPLFVNDRDGKPSEMLSRVMHAAMGMVTEAAEVIDMLKKHFIYGKPFDPVNLLEEVGDEEWYCALMLRATGYSFKEAFEKNVAKLQARFPDKFSEHAALNRDLTKERATLERKCRICGSGRDLRPSGDEWLCVIAEACDENRRALKP